MVVPHIRLALGEAGLGREDTLVGGLDEGGEDVGGPEVKEVEAALDRGAQAQALVPGHLAAPRLDGAAELLVRAVHYVSLLIVHQHHQEAGEGDESDNILEVGVLDVDPVKEGALP